MEKNRLWKFLALPLSSYMLCRPREMRILCRDRLHCIFWNTLYLYVHFICVISREISFTREKSKNVTVFFLTEITFKITLQRTSINFFYRHYQVGHMMSSLFYTIRSVRNWNLRGMSKNTPQGCIWIIGVSGVPMVYRNVSIFFSFHYY